MTELKQALWDARACTDALFRLVRKEALYERPVPERHRLVFYLGHVEAFDWNLLAINMFGRSAFHAEFDRLFAFGIDPPTGQLPSDQPSDWPSLPEIRRYNRQVREALDTMLDAASEELLHVAVEHRLMHAETFAYLLHNLSPANKDRPKHMSLILEDRDQPAPAHRMCDIPAGAATLGRGRADGFGWDNEFDAQNVRVPGFSISKYKVTNGEYLEFVRAGAQPPAFWVQRGNQWFLRRMFDEIPLPFSWPVYVTHQEAQSYAIWAGMTLPTEAQFHRAAYGTPSGEERAYPWGNALPDKSRGNFDFQRWDPVAVSASPGGDSAFGVSQLVGNGWEWTSTVFAPFPGFHAFAFYPGYSAPFFGEDHYVLKGGSPRTAARLLRRTYRNWFRPNYRYLYAGFHCVEN